MATTRKRLTRPYTVNDAADILDLGPRSGRRYAQLGLFGATRHPTAEERRKYGFPPHTRIIRDMGVVQRLRRLIEERKTRATLQQLVKELRAARRGTR